MCNGPEDPCPNCGRCGESTTEFRLRKMAEAWISYSDSVTAFEMSLNPNYIDTIRAKSSALWGMARTVVFPGSVVAEVSNPSKQNAAE